MANEQNNNNNMQNQQQNSSANPGGTLFQSTGDNKNGNNNQQNNNNQNDGNQNNSMDDIVASLTSGSIISNNDTSPEGNNQNNNNQNQNGNNKNEGNDDGKEQDTVIANIMKGFKGENLTAEIDTDKIAARMADGDLGGVIEAMETSAQAAVNRATKVVLDLIPEIVAHAKSQTMLEVNKNAGSDQVWNNFISEYPEYSPHKSMVREQLQQAIERGVPQKDAFQAIDMIFGNLKGSKPDTGNDTIFDVASNNEAFDLTGYSS